MALKWGEIRLAALQKLFSAEGDSINQADSAVREYLAAMPQAANEAVQRLCAEGYAPRRNLQIEKTAGRPRMADLGQIAPDLYRAEPLEAYRFDEDGLPRPAEGLTLAAGRYLVLPAALNGPVEVWYDAWPPVLAPATPDETEIGLAQGAEVLLPLYIASQLFKEDDAAIATQYRNEFEAALAGMHPAVGGLQGGSFCSEKGWC